MGFETLLPANGSHIEGVVTSLDGALDDEIIVVRSSDEEMDAPGDGEVAGALCAADSFTPAQRMFSTEGVFEGSQTSENRPSVEAPCADIGSVSVGDDGMLCGQLPRDSAVALRELSGVSDPGVTGVDFGIECTPLGEDSLSDCPFPQVLIMNSRPAQVSVEPVGVRMAGSSEMRSLKRRTVAGASSSEDESGHPPPNKKRGGALTGFPVNDVLDRMLDRLLELDTLRGKCSRIQGGISGKMKRLIMSLIEDLHEMDSRHAERGDGTSLPAGSVALMGISQRDEPGEERVLPQPCDCKDQERLVSSLTRENVTLRKKIEKLSKRAETAEKLKADLSHLEKEVLLRDMQIRTLKSKGSGAAPPLDKSSARLLENGKNGENAAAHGKPIVRSSERLESPVRAGRAMGPVPVRGASEPVTISQVEAIVARVMGKMGFGAAVGPSDGGWESPAPSKMDGPTRRIPDGLSNEGEWPSLPPQGGVKEGKGMMPVLPRGNGGGARPAGKKKRSRRKKMSLAALEARDRAAAGGAGAVNKIVEVVPPTVWRPAGVSWQRGPNTARRDPNAAVITVKCSEGAAEPDGKPVTYKEALACLRKEANLSELGIHGTSVRRGRDGGIVIALPREPDAMNKAKALVEKIKGKMPPGVKVACPQKMEEIAIHGLDPSVAEEEVLTAIAAVSGCQPADMTHSAIKDAGEIMGKMWIRCPVAAARRAAAAGSVRIGWTMARITLVSPKSVQCFRCLDFGHMKSECVSPFDRSGECYRCGDTTHKIADCPSALVKCAICPSGSNTHKTGSRTCAAIKAAYNRPARKGVKRTGLVGATAGGSALRGVSNNGSSENNDGLVTDLDISPEPQAVRQVLVGKRKKPSGPSGVSDGPST